MANTDSSSATAAELGSAASPSSPVLTAEAIVGFYPLPRQLVGEGNLFMIKMTGDAMIGAAIADGDQVVVRRGEADSGDIVAAIVDGEVRVRTLRRSGDQVWLVPHSAMYAPVPAWDSAILGRVVAVIRSVT